MKCLYCGYWNKILANKIFIEQPSSEPKVKALIPVYEPLEVAKCEKCGRIIVEPKKREASEGEFHFVKEELPTFEMSKQKRSRKVGIAILVISLVAILIIAFILFTGLPSSPPLTETTTCKVILQEISVFEDEACRKIVQVIDWGCVESSHSYSQTFYARNDYAKNVWDDRDLVWQRLNINPNSVYISIKVNYGDKQIKPNEVRQMNITLTVLGLFDSTGSLNPNAEIPQFAFDLKLIGKALNPFFPYIYYRCYALRDANNITVVYNDDLKETISGFIEIGVWKTKDGEQVMEVVWNSTKYSSEFTETWLEADIYTNYQLVVTINHERYGVLTYKNYLVGQLYP